MGNRFALNHWSWASVRDYEHALTTFTHSPSESELTSCNSISLPDRASTNPTFEICFVFLGLQRQLQRVIIYFLRSNKNDRSLPHLRVLDVPRVRLLSIHEQLHTTLSVLLWLGSWYQASCWHHHLD